MTPSSISRAGRKWRSSKALRTSEAVVSVSFADLEVRSEIGELETGGRSWGLAVLYKRSKRQLITILAGPHKHRQVEGLCECAGVQIYLT